MNFGKNLQRDFPKMRGGGQRPFGTFPKIHPFLKGQASPCNTSIPNIHFTIQKIMINWLFCAKKCWAFFHWGAPILNFSLKQLWCGLLVCKVLGWPVVSFTWKYCRDSLCRCWSPRTDADPFQSALPWMPMFLSSHDFASFFSPDFPPTSFLNFSPCFHSHLLKPILLGCFAFSLL